MSIRMIVGLGNPGLKYKDTRHNVGFMVLDLLAKQWGVSFKNDKRWKSELATHGGTLLVKPQTFMNDSGTSVGGLAHFFKLPPERILVIYDEVAFPFARFKFQPKGSDGGHNGMKSILSHLGTKDVPRLRFGIGSPRSGELIGHVLGSFSTEERTILQNGLDKAVEAVQFSLAQGIEAAANRYNAEQ